MFYATQFRGQTLAAIATDWTASAGTRWVIADATQQNSRCFQCSAGAGAQSCYRAGFTIGTRENIDCLVFADRQSGGLFDFQVDFNIVGATRAAGISTRIQRTANLTNSITVSVAKLGVDVDTPTAGIADAFAWTWRVVLTWSGADCTLTVYALQADYTWTSVHARTLTAPGTGYEAGVLGLHAVATTGRVFLNCMKVAAGTGAYVMLTRPLLDDTPFQRSTAAPHLLLVRGVCGNMTGATVEGRFVCASDPDPAWQTIDSAPGTTFAGEISTNYAEEGTVQVRPSTNTTAVDQIEGCRLCEIIIVAGQSNAQGRTTDKQAFTPAGDVADVLVWQAIIDGAAATGHTGNQFWAGRTDEATGTAHRFIYQSGNTEGTPWPHFFSELASRLNVPGAIIGHGEGTTGLASGTPTWQQGQTHYARLLLNLRRSGITKARCVIWVQGEYDCQNGGATIEADYLTQIVALRNNLMADSGIRVQKWFLYPLGQIESGSITTDQEARDKIDPVRAANYRAITEQAGFAWGGNVYFIDLEDDAGDKLHFKSTADAQAFGALMAYAFEREFYATQLDGPALEYCWWRSAYSVFVARFSRAIALAGTGTFAGTKVTVDGVEAAHTAAVSADGLELVVTLNTPTTAATVVRVYYPTGNSCLDGGVNTNKYLASAVGAKQAYPFVATVGHGRAERRRGRTDRLAPGAARLGR